MNLIEISCPSKTFALGEYGVLDGGPAVLLNTVPRFSCRIESCAKGQKAEIAAKSPAGQWLSKHPSDFSKARQKWSDPFKGRGGFGLSSAQFNILYACHALWQGRTIDQIPPQEIWRAYKSLKFEGHAPSGADTVSQWVGGVCVFEQEPLAVESLTLSLPDLECLIAKTGAALKTHEYLRELKLPDVSDLKRIAAEGVRAIKRRDEDSFLMAINGYGRAMALKGFLAPEVKEALDKISGLKEVKAIKGCGAMGAGAIIVFHKKEHEAYLREKMSFLEIVADASQLTYGVESHKASAPAPLKNGARKNGSWKNRKAGGK